jgi:hypothetical protein
MLWLIENSQRKFLFESHETFVRFWWKIQIISVKNFNHVLLNLKEISSPIFNFNYSKDNDKETNSSKCQEIINLNLINNYDLNCNVYVLRINEIKIKDFM